MCLATGSVEDGSAAARKPRRKTIYTVALEEWAFHFQFWFITKHQELGVYETTFMICFICVIVNDLSEHIRRVAGKRGL